MDCEAIKKFRKRQLITRQPETAISCPAGCPSPKRQRVVEHISTSYFASGNVYQEDDDILILDIDEFTVRQLNDVLKR
jgi:hypothetical protein